MKCTATTRFGEPCGNHALKDGKYCFRHAVQYEGSQRLPEMPEAELDQRTNGSFVRAFKCPHCGTLTEV